MVDNVPGQQRALRRAGGRAQPALRGAQLHQVPLVQLPGRQAGPVLRAAQAHRHGGRQAQAAAAPAATTEAWRRLVRHLAARR